MKYVLKILIVMLALTLGIVIDTIYMMLAFPYAMIHNYLILHDMRKVLSCWVNDMNDSANMAFKMSRDFIFGT